LIVNNNDDYLIESQKDEDNHQIDSENKPARPNKIAQMTT